MSSLKFTEKTFINKHLYYYYHPLDSRLSEEKEFGSIYMLYLEFDNEEQFYDTVKIENKGSFNQITTLQCFDIEFKLFKKEGNFAIFKSSQYGEDQIIEEYIKKQPCNKDIMIWWYEKFWKDSFITYENGEKETSYVYIGHYEGTTLYEFVEKYNHIKLYREPYYSYGDNDRELLMEFNFDDLVKESVDIQLGHNFERDFVMHLLYNNKIDYTHTDMSLSI